MTLPRPSRWIASALVVAAVATAAFVLTRRTAPAAGVEAPAAPFTFQYRWPAGTRYVYRLGWRADQDARVTLPGAAQAMPFHVTASLDANLVVRSLGSSGAGTVLGLSFEDFREHQFVFSGRALLPDAAAVDATFKRREALAEVGADGAVHALRFAPGDPDVFKHVVQGLMTDATLALPATAASAWTATEVAPAGRARSEYRVVRASPPTIERTRPAYEQLDMLRAARIAPHQLDSRATFVLDPAGYLRSVAHHEAIALEAQGTSLRGTTALTLDLISVTSFAPPARVELASRSDVRRPGEHVTDDRMRQRMLEQRAAGLTVDALKEDLRRAVGGRVPDHNAWLWHATGALLLHPERCHELAEVFADPSLDGPGRALVLDVLAGAGSPEAQETLRALLDSPASKQDLKERVLLLQRLSLVEHPTPETVRYAAERFAAAEGPERIADGYSLGAVLGHLKANGEGTEQVRELGGQLVDGLRRARTPTDEQTYLRALGNAGLPEATAEIIAHAGSPDADVRAAAASALRKIPAPEATAALIDLAGARESDVQAAAFDALRGRTLSSGELDRLAALAAAGKVDERNLGLLVAAVSPSAGNAAGRAVLQALAPRITRDAALRARVQALLAAHG